MALTYIICFAPCFCASSYVTHITIFWLLCIMLDYMGDFELLMDLQSKTVISIKTTYLLLTLQNTTYYTIQYIHKMKSQQDHIKKKSKWILKSKLWLYEKALMFQLVTMLSLEPILTRL